MDRRSFLKAKMGKRLKAANAFETAPPPPAGGLTLFTGNFTEVELTHLLKRTLFGVSKADLNYFKNKKPV